MNNLHPEVKIEIKPSRNVRPDQGDGHGWTVFRRNRPIGAGWSAGDVKDAFEDALDDLRMLGLVETTEATSG